MKIKIANIVAVSGLSLACGCDFFGAQAKKVEILKLEQQQAERVSSERKDMAAALKVYIEGKCKIVAEEQAKVSARVKELQTDVDQLEKTAVEALDSRDSSAPSYEVRLLRLLKAPTIDTLAKKYLATGFSVQCEKFIAKIREVREQQKKYEAALSNIDAEFASKKVDVGGWSDSNRSRNAAEAKRLRNEIHGLENRLSSLRKSLRGPRSSEVERAHKISEVEMQLHAKRRQLDAMLSPSSNLALETRAASEHQFAVNEARRARDNERREADRRLKPKASETDVANEIESQTLGLLRKEMKARQTSLTERLEVLEKKVRQSKELLLETSVCEGDELKRLRVRADATLTLEPAR